MTLIKVSDLNLTQLYYLYLDNKNYKKQQPHPLSYFSLFMHKKLNYYKFIYNDKQTILSNGQLLKIRTKLTKFFKKSRKSIGSSVNTLNKLFSKQFNKINFFYCKNYNYRNYLWLKKYTDLIKPTIHHMMITRGWNYVHKYKRRIKKKIYRNLIKQSFVV